MTRALICPYLFEPMAFCLRLLPLLWFLCALKFASANLKGDKELVLAAVAQKGVVLRYASEDLKGDKELVLAAVMQDGYALDYASEDLKCHKEVVLVAVTQNGGALKYASETSRVKRSWCSRPLLRIPTCFDTLRMTSRLTRI